jgi:hypothetical protein
MNLLSGTGILGLLLLAIGGWMMWRKKSRKIITWLWLFSGFTLGGSLAASVVEMFQQAGGAGADMFGVGVRVFLGVVGVIMVLELWHAAHPKKGTPKTWHPILALVAPMLIGGASGGILHSVFAGISGLLGHMSGPVAALFGA